MSSTMRSSSPNHAAGVLVAGIGLAAVLAACGGGSSGSVTSTVTPTPTPQPNLVVVMGNDMDATATDTALTLTKSLIADQGARFTRFYATRTLATSSRVTFLTGKYSHNHGILSNSAPGGGFAVWLQRGLEAQTLATRLQAAGYYTGLLGRYLTGYPEGGATNHIAPGWNEWYVLENPQEHDANRYFDYTLNDNGRLVAKGHAAEDYSTDVLARRAVEVVRQASADKPLFLWIAPFACRNPAVAAPRHEGRFASATAPRVASRNEADVSDKPTWIKARALLTAEELDAQDEIARGRLRTLLSMDELVRDVVDALQSSGRLANTYILVTTDHGYRIGAEHRIRHGKQTAYEEDAHIPLFVRGPGISAGRTIDQLSIMNDLFPTLLELGGATVPSDSDGRSLAALWGTSPPTAWRRAFLIQHWRSSQDQGIPEWRALHTATHTYVEWPAGTATERELYDLSSDPWQVASAHGTQSAANISALSTRLAELGNCSGAACRSGEDGSLPF